MPGLLYLEISEIQGRNLGDFEVTKVPPIAGEVTTSGQSTVQKKTSSHANNAIQLTISKVM